MSVHHVLEQILNEYIEAAGLQSGQPGVNGVCFVHGLLFGQMPVAAYTITELLGHVGPNNEISRLRVLTTSNENLRLRINAFWGGCATPHMGPHRFSRAKLLDYFFTPKAASFAALATRNKSS
jgi:hypothetical protein